MERKQGMVLAGALALAGVAAGGWSLANFLGASGSPREFGRVGMAEPAVGPGADGFAGGGDGDMDIELGEGGERVMRRSPEDLPEGMRMLIEEDDGMDPSEFVFAEIDDESDARVMLDELESAVSANAMGAKAYRQAPPIGKQRFAASVASFVEPYVVESAREVSEGEDEAERPRAFAGSRGLERLYFGSTLALASLDVSHLRVGDGGGGMRFELPEELMAGLPAEVAEGDGGEGGGRRMEFNFSSSAGGWSTHESTHPMSDSAHVRGEEVPLAQVTVPLRAPKLGADVVRAELQVSMWWDESRGAWEPENTTVRYLTESEGDEGEDRRLRMRRGGSRS